MQSSGRRAALLLAACLPIAGCFEQPIAESLLLAFLPDHTVTVTATVAIRYLEDDNQALRQRVDEARQALLEGRDDWSRRLEALRPVHERAEIEKLEGAVTRAVRSGTTDAPEGLRRYFADTGLDVVWTQGETRGELLIHPGAAGRATRRERQEVARALGEWSSAIADYLAAAGSLYSYLERHPDRERACFALLFDVSAPADSTGEDDSAAVTPEETALLEGLDSTMDQVAGALLVAKGEAYSLDEMSRRVYDPFPAALTVQVPGELVELEGFENPTEAPDGAAGHVLRVRELGLWAALRSLEGAWIQPDPLLAMVEHDLAGTDAGFDLDGWLEKDRRSTGAPAPQEIRRRLEARLRPAPAYRAAWTMPRTQSEPL